MRVVLIASEGEVGVALMKKMGFNFEINLTSINFVGMMRKNLLVLLLMTSMSLVMSATTAPVDNAEWEVDTVSVQEVLRQARLNAGIEQQSPAEQTSVVPKDSIIGWFTALKRGKVDFRDKHIHYPKIARTVYNTIQWYHRTFNHYDSTYVAGTGKKFKVTLKNDNWFDSYDYSDEGTVKFHCKPASTIGLSFSAFGLSVGYNVGIDRIRGHADTGKKWELGFNCARFSIEFHTMTNAGDMTLDIIEKDGKKIPIQNFSGLKRKFWGINAYYVFNNQRYCQSASYSFSRIQMRSAGSWLAGFNISHRKFSVRYGDLPEWVRELNEDDATTSADEVETLFDYTDYNLSGGYGYNWVPGRHWLINVTGLIYTGVKYAHAKSSADGGRTFWAINGKARLGVSYDLTRFFVGINGYIDSHFFNTGPYRFRSHLFDMAVQLGVRF